MKQKHIVLRSAPAPLEEFLGPGATRSGTSEAAVTGLNVEIDEIEAREAPRVARDRSVLAVAPVMPMKLIEPRDLDDSAQPAAGGVEWGVKAVGADTSPFTGAGMVVSVLDTGIASNHNAFQGMQIIERDFTGSGNGDHHGHGTHCAGTIFGRDVNGTRIGVAQGVQKALIGKVLGPGGGGSDAIVDAINWSIENGANVISMSLGIDFPGFVERLINDFNFPEELATTRALEGYRQNVMLFERVASVARSLAQFRQPCLIVAAAGNESRRNEDPNFEIAVSPPAVSEGNISVAALGEGDGSGFTVASFSNTNALVAGPGVHILSAKPTPNDGLQLMSGTSMATPHVAGVAALWGEKLAGLGTLNPLQWSARLIGGCVTDSLKSPFDPADVGSGMVRAPQD